MVKKELIKIKDLVLDEKYYPRLKVGWKTAYAYAQAMKTGAKFPPVLVGLFKGKKYLLDGWHRIEAYKNNKEEYIEAELILFKNEKEMFLAAVRCNAVHGKPYSIQEKVDIANRLQGLKVEQIQISKITGIPLDRLPVLINRKTLTLPNGTKIAIKSSLENVKEDILEHSEDEPFFIESVQSDLTGNKIDFILDDLLNLLELKAFQPTKDMISKFSRIKVLIDKILEENSITVEVT